MRIATALIVSVAGAVMPDVVKVRCRRAWLSKEWSGSWFIDIRKWSVRYFLADSGLLMLDEKAGEESMSSCAACCQGSV